jgi:hypothetical protein
MTSTPTRTPTRTPTPTPSMNNQMPPTPPATETPIPPTQMPPTPPATQTPSGTITGTPLPTTTPSGTQPTLTPTVTPTSTPTPTPTSTFVVHSPSLSALQMFVIPNHRRGDTWAGFESFIIKVNNTPVDLTNASIKIDFRKQIDSPVALTLSTANGSVVLSNPSQGIFSIPPRIINIPFGIYLYDIQVTYPNGVVTTYVEGTWEIVADITD